MRPTEDARGNGTTRPLGNVAWFVGQMLIIPLRTFVYGMEKLLETMRGLQSASDRGMHVIAGGESVATDSESRPEPGPAVQETGFNGDAAMGGTTTVIEEKKIMDKDLSDDMLKLVRFKILFVKRDYEHAFPEQEELVSDNMDGSAFTAWKIAEFIQTLHRKDTKIPNKWRDKNYPAKYSEGGQLTGLPEDDKKYLRVYYEVLERYPREKFRYQEEQIDVLKEIRDKMPQSRAGSS
jgi:hypothetical protein